ncbi:MAG: CHAD domain-containing protein [Anaerolineae bacterium]|nr:CHAD domain-containing protein [Anaerolineae bacterium]
MVADKKQAEKPAMLVNDHVAEASRKVFLGQLLRMKAQEAGSRTGEDIESVHKMRVAVRRMRSLLRLVSEYHQSKTIAKTEKKLRQIARALGAIRDLDVLILELQHFSAALSPDAQQQTNALISRLERRRAKRRKRLNTFFDSKGYERSLRQLESFAENPGERARRLKRPHEPHELRHVLPLLLHQRLARVRAYDTVLPASDDKRLHALRVECKRLRYALEFFAPVLGSSVDGFLALIKAMQDTLGRINDIAVFVSQLQGLDELSPEQAALVEDYIASRNNELIRLRSIFRDEWTRFNTRAVQRKFSDAVLVLR